MAQADFDFYLSGIAGGVLPMGGLDGLPILHSSLISPLLFHGNYGREYRQLPTSSGTMNSWVARVNLPDFVDVPITKGVSIRAWVRVKDSTTPAVDGTTESVGISARTPASASAAGYHLLFGKVLDWVGTNINGTAGSLALRLCLRKPDGSISGSFPDVVIAGSYAVDTWYAIRFDIIPVGGAKDRIDVYSGVADGFGVVTWTLAMSQDVLVTDPVYNPPGATTRLGYTTISTNVAGYVDTSNPASGYIDALDIYVADV
jgi:hypothetical protein